MASQEEIEILKRAQVVLVGFRQAVAGTIAGAGDQQPENIERWTNTLLRHQAGIEALGKAITDAEAEPPSGHEIRAASPETAARMREHAARERSDIA